MLNLIFMSRRLMTEFQGTVIFMALELLRSQDEHLTDEKAARKKGSEGPPTLSTERQAHHDLESFLWVLVYAMMIHHYNSLTRDTDRTEYKETLDSYFGHGGVQVITEKRQAMYLAHSRVGNRRVSRWFPDPLERKFFIRCMTLIAENDREEEEEEEEKKFKGEISARTPLCDRDDDESDSSPDEDAEDQSGTYKPSSAAREDQGFVGLRTRPPVITYKSVLTILKKALKGL